MEHIVVLGNPRGTAKFVAALSGLPLHGPPLTSVVLVGDDRSGLARAVHETRAVGAKVIVVALQPLSNSTLVSIASQAEDVLDWNETTVEAIAARLARWREIDNLLDSPEVASLALGTATAYRESLGQVIELARHSHAPVLLTGETGTGKEVAARVLHRLSPRDGQPMSVFDCTTIVPTLSGSELFGHERGAFTGADSTRSGAISAADGGTLFLDEVGELALPIQAELLRVIEDGTYKRVGGNRWLHADFRLVSATNRDLHEEVTRGRFRHDLYHRIAGAVVELPPLRDRRVDIEQLFTAFLAEAMRTGSPPPLAAGVLQLLRERDYPGNLRDLRQLAVRVAARHAGPGSITIGDLPPDERGLLGAAAVRQSIDPPDELDTATVVHEALRRVVTQLVDRGDELRTITRLVTDTAVEVALDESSGSTRAAARRLGVTERAIQLRRAAVRAVDAV